MTAIKYDIKCPKCSTKNRFKVNDVIDSSKSNSIIDKSIFHLSCKNCKQDIYVEYPFKVVGSNYIIYYTPTKNDAIEEEMHEYMRVCDTYEDLKEKLLIFNDNYNDIVIEFIKSFLLTQIDEDLRKTLTDIRYNGNNNDNLLFSLIGSDKIIGCNKVFYTNLIKKMKFKKINKCVLVDKYTYTKFYKMRLFS
jgi:hypothetical protein